MKTIIIALAILIACVIIGYMANKPELPTVDSKALLQPELWRLNQ